MDVRIALDPGHIGGQYSEMEGRHFALNGSFPVKEGDLAIICGQLGLRKN